MAPASMKDKVVAITGGAGGIGFALASLLADEGAVLALADSSAEALEVAAKPLALKGVKVLTTELDVRNVQQVDAWIAEVVAACGRLDGAANLAGIFRHSGPIAETKTDEFEVTMGVNVTGVLNCMRAEINAMERGGSIVNASSVAGLRACPRYSAYSASKHAVLGLTRAAAVECGPKGIRVNAICPGLTQTKMVDDQKQFLGPNLVAIAERVPLARHAVAEEPARLIRFLLSEDSGFINGAAQVIDGGSSIR